MNIVHSSQLQPNHRKPAFFIVSYCLVFKPQCHFFSHCCSLDDTVFVSSDRVVVSQPLAFSHLTIHTPARPQPLQPVKFMLNISNAGRAGQEPGRELWVGNLGTRAVADSALFTAFASRYPSVSTARGEPRRCLLLFAVCKSLKKFVFFENLKKSL